MNFYTAKALPIFIAIIWLMNGFVCKVLNLVPRHQEIVSRILGERFSHPITILIGVSEIFMAVWILSKKLPRLNTWTQILIVSSMNILELILAKDLLLWGAWNIVWAFIFISLVWCARPNQA